MTTGQPQTPGKGYLAALNGLRGVAAITVVYYHIGQQFDLRHHLHHGYLAVPFFFVLSGFVIARSYEERILSGKMLIIQFVVIRLIRLFPFILASAFISACLGAAPKYSILAALLIPVASPGVFFPANAPEWSLMYELLGNLVHSVVLRRLTNRILAVALATSFLLIISAIWKLKSASLGWSGATWFGGAALFSFGYCSGITLHRSRGFPMLRLPTIPLWAVCLILVAALSIPQRPDTNLYALRDILSTTLLFPAILLVAIRIEVKGWIERLCLWAGELSYPLYILHFPIVTAVAVALRHQISETQVYVASPVLIALCISISWILLRCYDRPIRQLFSSIVHLGRAQPSAGPA